MKYYIFFVFFLFIFDCYHVHARPDVDSLVRVLPGMKDDSNKVEVENAIAIANRDENPEQALEMANDALELAERLNWKPGMALSYNVLGICYRNMGKYPEALDNLLHSLRISEELKDDQATGKIMGNISGLYRALENYPKAMEYLNRAYAINERTGDIIGMTNNLSDKGIISAQQKDYNAAIQYFEEALKISTENDDKEGVAIALGNIANIYSEQKNIAKAVEFFERSLAINKDLNRPQGIVTNIMNLGDMHYKIAIDSTGNKIYGGGIPRGKDANLAKAINYYSQAVPIYTKVSHLEGLFAAYKGLAASYSARGDNKRAFEALENAVAVNDSIRSTDNNVKLARLGEERAELEKKQQVAITKLTQTKRRNETILFIGGILALLIFTGFVIKERRKSEKLLLNILPKEVADELKKDGKAGAHSFDEVTVLFTDFVNFTSISEKMVPQYLVDELHACFKAFDDIVTKYKIEKIKTVGDAYLAVAGLPLPNERHAENVVNAAIEIAAFMTERKKRLGDKSFDVRVGINSGSVVAGIVGVKKFAYDIWGDTVNIASRMEQHSEAGKINISEATHALVKDKFKCTYRGEVEVKNKGKMGMYFVDAGA